MWLKICGLTDAAAVDAAVQSGADALGFVFAPSVRAVTPRVAAALAGAARGRCQLVAVTLHPAQELIDELLEGLRPDVLQSDWTDLQQLRLPQQLVRLPVLRASAGEGVVSLPEPLPVRALFEGARSGTGVASDWGEASRLARRTELILAGGLHPGNVAQAIDRVRPYGVDVSTGVESFPGRKSPALIAQFIAAARAVAQDAA